MRNMIIEGIKESHEDFRNNPFDWNVNEIEAQVRLFNVLRKNILGTINITRKAPMPAYENMKAHRVKLEYGILDPASANRKPDICIFKENITEMNFENLEAFVEIKVGWGYNDGQLNGDSIKKDFRFISLAKEKGYIVYFIGNNFDYMKENYKTEVESYKKSMKDNLNEINFNPKNVFLVFRDIIFDGNFNEI